LCRHANWSHPSLDGTENMNKSKSVFGEAPRVGKTGGKKGGGAGGKPGHIMSDLKKQTIEAAGGEYIVDPIADIKKGLGLQ
jgi:hypothetical protein